MKILLSVFFTIQISAGLANIDSVTRVDTIDNWQIYLDKQHLLSSNDVAVYHNSGNVLVPIKINEQAKELKIYFGGCITWVDYLVEAVDEKDQKNCQFELKAEMHRGNLPLVIPVDFLRENEGRRIKFYRMDPERGIRKYLLIELEILGD